MLGVFPVTPALLGCLMLDKKILIAAAAVVLFFVKGTMEILSPLQTLTTFARKDEAESEDTLTSLNPFQIRNFEALASFSAVLIATATCLSETKAIDQS
jgi:hypothetical protein